MQASAAATRRGDSMAATWVTYLGYVAVASVIWFLVDFISCVVAARVSITFVRRASRTVRERARWRSRIVSTLHAIYGSCAATYVICYGTWTWEESLFSADPLKMVLLAGSVGYFVFDTYVMIVSEEKEAAFYLHHAIVGGGMLIAMLSEFCAFAFVAMTVNEFTTPMLNIAWAMERMRLTKTKWFALNGIIMTVGFFCARICFNIYIAYHYLSPETLGRFPYPIGNTTTTWSVAAVAAFFFPLFFLYLFTNIFWFAKLVGKLKEFTSGNPAPTFDDESDGERHLMELDDGDIDGKAQAMSVGPNSGASLPATRLRRRARAATGND